MSTQKPPKDSLGPLEQVVAYLALRHSEDQESIKTWLLATLFPLWQLMRFQDLDASTVVWVRSVLPIVEESYFQSQRVASVFAANVRAVELPGADPIPMSLPDVAQPVGVPSSRFNLVVPNPVVPDAGEVVEFDPFPLKEAAKSLAIEANALTKQQMPGPEDGLMDAALKRSSGAAVRHAIDGQRNVTSNLLKFDRKIQGYARFTDGDPCYFCAILASQGAVFGKGSYIDSDAKFDAPNGIEYPPGFIPAKVHNNCACSLRPVYTKDRWDSEAKFYLGQWLDVTKARENRGLSWQAKVNRFRRQFKTFDRAEPNLTELRDVLQRRESALINAGFDPASPQVLWAAGFKSQLA